MKKFFITIVALFVCSQICFAQNQQSYKYDVSDYKATFFLPKKGADVRVVLDITYRIGNEEKGDGFKFVGTNDVKDVKCVCENNDRCTVEVQHLRETKIVWRFSPVRNTTKKVSVSFVIKNQLRRQGNVFSFTAPWAGIFRVPVEKAQFDLVFSQGVEPKIIEAFPSPHEQSWDQSVCHITMSQSPLARRELVIKYQE